jgi:hypothetical protein
MQDYLYKIGLASCTKNVAKNGFNDLFINFICDCSKNIYL